MRYPLCCLLLLRPLGSNRTFGSIHHSNQFWPVQFIGLTVRQMRQDLCHRVKMWLLHGSAGAECSISYLRGRIRHSIFIAVVMALEKATMGFDGRLESSLAGQRHKVNM